MISRLEHIGQDGWAKRLRKFLADLFGSRYVKLLERDLLQFRMECDRARSDAKAAQERLLEVMASVKGIPLRPLPATDAKPPKPVLPPTQWQQIVAAEQQKIAREEEAERKSAAPKEN